MSPVGAGQLRTALVDLRIELFALTHAVAQSVDLSYCDLVCLDVIRRAGQISPSELGRRTATHAATMTGIVRRLEGRGWIERVAHPDDGRAVLLRLPEDRAERLDALYRDADRRISAVNRARTSAERAALAAYLGEINTAVHESFEARPHRRCGRGTAASTPQLQV